MIVIIVTITFIISLTPFIITFGVDADVLDIQLFTLLFGLFAGVMFFVLLRNAWAHPPETGSHLTHKEVPGRCVCGAMAHSVMPTGPDD